MITILDPIRTQDNGFRITILPTFQIRSQVKGKFLLPWRLQYFCATSLFFTISLKALKNDIIVFIHLGFWRILFCFLGWFGAFAFQQNCIIHNESASHNLIFFSESCEVSLGDSFKPLGTREHVLWSYLPCPLPKREKNQIEENKSSLTE